VGISDLLADLRDTAATAGLWLLAIPAGVLPKRLWRQLEPPLPIVRSAGASGIVTLVTGFFLAVGGFLSFATRSADLHNDWMLRNISIGCPGPSCSDHAYRVALVPYGVSAVTLFAFLFFTPLGLFSMYLVLSGLIRALSAFVGDPRGDFLLSGAHWAAATSAASFRARRAQAAREELEGVEVPDVLGTGEWAGLAADYVVIASRRKSEDWAAGAIILSKSGWYRLGNPLESDIDGHLRTLYPLTKLDVPEVVRRGIAYELPHLSPRYARRWSSRNS
jgi:hypothetical protein